MVRPRARAGRTEQAAVDDGVAARPVLEALAASEGGRGGEGRRRALELDGGERVAAGGENEGAGASTPVGLSRDTRARGWTQHCPVVKLDFSFSIRKG